MKLDPKTMNVLKNFSTVNPSILIKEGNTLATISPSKTILAKAKVPDNFTKRFAIYELSKFIGSVSLVDNAELTFGDNSVKISDGNGTELNYTYADESTIKVPPEKELKLPSVDVNFDFTDASFREVIKAAGVLSLPEIAAVGEGGNVYLQAIDSKNPSNNTFKIKVGKTDKTFRAIFKTENIIKILSGDYKVEISSKGISHFVGTDAEYWISVESNSTF